MTPINVAHITTLAHNAPIPLTHEALAVSAANRCELSVPLFRSVITAESNWDPYALSPVGAYGLGQLMPATAAWLNINYRNPNDNLIGSACYLSSLIAQFGSVQAGLSAYHAGPGNVTRGNIGRRTRAYVRKVLALTEAAD